MIHSRVSWMFLPVDRSITVSAPHKRRPAQLVDFLVDRGGDGGVADVRVDLHQEVAADDHRLELEVVDVGGDDRAAARDLVADELGRQSLADRDELHLRRDLALARVVQLRHAGVRRGGSPPTARAVWADRRRRRGPAGRSCRTRAAAARRRRARSRASAPARRVDRRRASSSNWEMRSLNADIPLSLRPPQRRQTRRRGRFQGFALNPATTGIPLAATADYTVNRVVESPGDRKWRTTCGHPSFRSTRHFR